MNLLPGYRFAVAPKFHLNADWSSRLALSAGLEESDGKFFPHGSWRAPTPEELALLVAREPSATSPGALPLLDDPAPVRAGASADHICLFQRPEHLREAWWNLVGESADSGAPMKGFDAFAARVGDFLTFKGLGGAAAQMEALVTAPGARSIRVDSATGAPRGLGPTIAPWSEWPLGASAVPRLRAVVNLGDEALGVVVINLALPDLASELARRAPTDPPATVGELVAQFGAKCPDYPPVRLQLGPGEGCRLPTEGLILDGDATDNEEPAVTLLISE